MNYPPVAIPLRFVDADPTTPDPAAVGALARGTVGALRQLGTSVEPQSTGAKSGAEVFLWFMAAAGVAQTLVALPDFALKVAQLLTEVKKLSNPPPPTPATPPSAGALLIVVIRIAGTTATLPVATTPTDHDLLHDLLAQTLPTTLDPATITVDVQVPATPPNEL
ncbi:hypothetical protein EYB53_024830 [Candidatus Chloroploca sp. M-50]|uniref:Uncharacterized protein n=1 Tax=Candidatus Chloroploca mongolica TaxID=2528176 RepID=A0ABS4DHP1_9CHLR|nr:hypothetical protein [Candidatus Chloroploca mongolica]MBP1468957.1 hypothetical protein [Candidatus Chloroploca mongolica]